jgi:hypothetical protein
MHLISSDGTAENDVLNLSSTELNVEVTRRDDLGGSQQCEDHPGLAM